MPWPHGMLAFVMLSLSPETVIERARVPQLFGSGRLCSFRKVSLSQ